jgi:hypothetical protein
MSTATATTGDWLSASEAAAVLQIERHHVSRLARQGRLVRRDLPCVRKYWRPSVERLAREAIDRARGEL